MKPNSNQDCKTVSDSGIQDRGLGINRPTKWSL